MLSLEESFEKACNDGTIPGAVLMAANKAGTFKYAKVFGLASLDSKFPRKPLEMDAVLYIASCTKLMTSIAAMQLIEKGKVTLDDDVTQTLPEIEKVEILTGFDDTGKPIMKKRENVMTLRHLLTHSAGMTYDVLSPKILQYRKYRNQPISTGRTVAERFGGPLLYEPGTGWAYSPSLDWAGKFIERVSGQTLEEYMKQHIWTPLGIKDITFWPESRPSMKARMTDMSIRDPNGSGKVVHGGGSILSAGFEECMGGDAAYASMPDYFKILQSLLADDERLLKKETTKLMFSPQLSKESREAQAQLMANPQAVALFIGDFPMHVGLDWGLGGILTTDDDEGWRKKGTMLWSGLPNLFWFIDREAGLCGLFGTQVRPPGDNQVGEMITLFEKAMYEKAGSAKAKM